MSTNEKICNTCNILKHFSEYTINKRYKYGIENRCKDCFKIYLSNKKDKLQESQKKWKQKNPDYMKEYQKKYEIIAYQKKYYKENSQIYKQWRINNSERELNSRQKYIEKNKEKLNEYQRKWKQNKRENDINYKLQQNISRRIRYELNTLLKGKKTKRTTQYIGCTIEELKTYIEKLFNDDMNWENYGSYWHIDHIIPCIAWNFSLENDNNYCWNFRNLQPLESSANQSKKDRYNEDDKFRYIEQMKLLVLPTFKE